MIKKILSGIALTMLLVEGLALTLGLSPLEASGTIYIRPDGSVEPTTAPISRAEGMYTFTDMIEDSIVVQKSDIIVDGAGRTLEGMVAGEGITLSDMRNVTIRNMTIKSFNTGIYLEECSSCSIIETNITMSYSNGIHAVGSSNNDVSRNNISLNRIYGVFLAEGSSENTLSGNKITGNVIGGVALSQSSNNNIDGNSLTANAVGLSLLYSSDNRIHGNSVINNTDGGIFLYWSSNNNSISGNGLTNNNNSVLIDSSSFNNVSRNDVANSLERSIWLSDSMYNTITGNNMTGSGLDGLLLRSSSYNTLAGNSITDSATVGVVFDISHSNSITENRISACHEGFRLNGSSLNHVSANTIADNSIGVAFNESSENTVLHNNFLNNTNQTSIEESVNVWDGGYSSAGVGNYWDEYNGNDIKCGEEQDFAGSDMIGDAHYFIDKDNVDRYPLMKPWPTPIPLWNFENESMVAISDSSLADFKFNQNLGEISFNVTTNTVGSCRVIVAKTLLDGAFDLLVDNAPVVWSVSWNSKYHMINFNYSVGTHNVRIAGEHVQRPPIREFPDLNGDGIIDIFDAIILASNWGKQL